MSKQNTYKDLVFTNHAYHRLRQRNVSEHTVWETVHTPQRSSKKGESIKYIRTVNDRNYHVVATYLPKEKKHLVISVWVRGEDDQAPLIWRVITLPFWLIWKVVQWLFSEPKK